MAPPGEFAALKQRVDEALSRKDWESALTICERALLLRPRDAELHNARARALDSLERHEEALREIDEALKVQPRNAADLKNRGVLLRRLGRPAEALASFDGVLAVRPGDPDILVRRAHLLLELERREEALESTEEVLARQPHNLEAINARGVVLERLGRYREALESFERILSMRADHTDALNNRGMVLARYGDFAGALAAYDRSLAVDPEQPQAFYNRSLVRLALGDWRRGLKEFEGRWNVPPLKALRLKTAAPLWLGEESLRGRTLFLHHEQGYGDTLQAVRYVPKLAALGAKVVLAVTPALTELMRSLPGGPTIVGFDRPPPPHDFHCPLMSLLLAFGVTPDTIEAEEAYLRADPQRVRVWKERLGPKRRPRIGLVWSGRQYPPVNYPRDMPLTALQPLLALDADFISLQKDTSERDREVASRTTNLDCRLIAKAGDFADTAALIGNLDLVVSVDTAVAHLAGALGRPVWLLNRFASCWRWLQRGSQSAWYPSMRIFRQRAVGDWSEVVSEVHLAAAQFLKEERGDALQRPTATAAEVRVTPGSGSAQVRLGGPEKIRLVCATRLSVDQFFATAPLGRSLPFYQTFPPRQRIELRLFKENTQGLPSVYNIAIEEAKADPAILVFIHDDVYLTDYYWAEHLHDGLKSFDIVGLAGNRRRVPGQASWMYTNSQFKRDQDENLSGVLGHGESFPNLKELSVYGPPCQPVKLLDGVMLAVRSQVLIETDLRFDPRFTFHFYDLDFCREAEQRGIRMGTWAISVIHASAGKLGGEAWRAAYQEYLRKYGEA